jgi:hypothetical protein
MAKGGLFSSSTDDGVINALFGANGESPAQPRHALVACLAAPVRSSLPFAVYSSDASWLLIRYRISPLGRASNHITMYRPFALVRSVVEEALADLEIARTHFHEGP